MKLRIVMMVAAAVMVAVGDTNNVPDVYGIENPTNRLAAIRAKWPHAADRVSMWEMPDYEERFHEIDEFQDWCEEDKTNRYARFETACRDAIKMKIEPAIWYYNLACALAVQKKPTDEVFAALEQAIAAGYDKIAHMREDEDLVSVTNDVRFAKLCGMMEAISGRRWDEPQKELREMDGDWRLDDDNVYYVLTKGSYLCDLATTNDCPIVYLNHHEDHSVAPCEGLIIPKFPKEAVERRRNIGAANMHFCDVRTGEFVTTAVASNCTYEEDRLNKSMSIPAVFGIFGERANREARHYITMNVLGIYTAGSDYAVDGIDRFIGHFPACIAHTGGAEEADKFVRLFRDIVRTMRPNDRSVASIAALNIIRHAQRCVTNEASFMDGMAQRPVLSFADIDIEKAIAAAKLMMSNPPTIPFIKKASLAFEMTPVTDLWSAPYDRPHLAHSVHHEAFIAVWGERTGLIDVEIVDDEAEKPHKGELVWKVLQGDEDKVRILPQGKDASKVRIEVDYHKVFDVALPNGKTVRSSRVDVGCFRVVNGRASVPAIVSVYFNPNETREYGADGKLVSIDYTKRPIEGWRPQFCAKGAWKDTFNYTKNGKTTGWTRVMSDENGTVTTNEFTREGLVVMTRDALGRPKDVRRDMKMEWTQDYEGLAVTGQEYSVHMSMKGILYDQDERPPAETTLAWQYTYAGDGDMFGKPSPKPFKPFAYRPELCTRAEFSEASGFRLPLVDQMMLGNAEYLDYKHGLVGSGDPNDLVREDSPLALKKRGLVPPKVLKRMKFCPWKPGTNDLWKIDMDDFEKMMASNLVKLADGAYRIRKVDGDGEEKCQTVRDTYQAANLFGEALAIAKLDKDYKRCNVEEVKSVWSKFNKTVDWGKTLAFDGREIPLSELPDGMESTLAMWRMPSEIYFGIRSYPKSEFGQRQYFFAKICDDGTSFDFFAELPSRVIGNAMLGADTGDADAINNYAVLFYAGVANGGCYEEDAVVKLLFIAAKKGCVTAMYNLGVLYENRGEESKAKECYKAAECYAADSQKQSAMKEVKQ